MSTPKKTISGLVAHWRTAVPATESLTVDFGDLAIETASGSSALMDSLRDYFREFLVDTKTPDILVTAHEAPAPETGLEFQVKEPDPGKTKIKEEWADIPGGRVVRKRLTGMHFFFGNGDNAAVGPCAANDNQVINFVNNRYIEHKLRAGCLLGHAAGVHANGRGMSLAGFSGMGKSTLALHIMNLGADFVSNDRIMVEPAASDGPPTMYGVAKHPRINPGTLINNHSLAALVSPEDRERFRSMPPDELWNLELKYDAPIEACYGPGRFRLKAPMNRLTILNWRRDGSPLAVREVNPAERGDLLPAFMKSAGLFYLPPDGAEAPPTPDDYVRALSGCIVTEISGGVDFEAAAQACMDLLTA